MHPPHLVVWRNQLASAGGPVGFWQAVHPIGSSCFTQITLIITMKSIEIYEVPQAHRWGYIANLSRLYLRMFERKFSKKHINLPEGGLETFINDTKKLSYSTLLPIKKSMNMDMLPTKNQVTTILHPWKWCVFFLKFIWFILPPTPGKQT